MSAYAELVKRAAATADARDFVDSYVKARLVDHVSKYLGCYSNFIQPTLSESSSDNEAVRYDCTILIVLQQPSGSVVHFQLKPITVKAKYKGGEVVTTIKHKGIQGEYLLSQESDLTNFMRELINDSADEVFLKAQ